MEKQQTTATQEWTRGSKGEAVAKAISPTINCTELIPIEEETELLDQLRVQ